MNVNDRVNVGGFIMIGLLVGWLAAVPVVPTIEELMILWMLVALATIAQFFEVKIADQRTYYPHNVFFFAGVLLLPPMLLAPLYTIPLSVDVWRTGLREGRPTFAWYDLILNVAAHTLIGSAAHWMYFTMNNNLASLFQIGQVFAAIVAITTYVLGNHLFFRLADVLINRSSWRESAIWMTENIWTELIMAYLGYVVAVLWYVNPVMILPMLGLMFLLQQALMIPQLQLEAQTDSKTGLLNVRYFNQYFDEWLERAKRQGRPLSVMMADLDYLRRINNNYGHLAGDLVLIGVSEIIRRSVRSQDIVGRFGGEEFAILLPDTDQEEAFQVAEAVRQAIAETDFAIPTNPTPIRATMTLGIACFPDDATTATDLLHHADVAVYQAKMDGRNRVACASDLFYRIKSEGSFAAEESSTESSRKSESSVDQPPQPRLLDLPVHVPHLSTSMLEDEAMNLPGWYRWLSDTVLKSVMIAFALLLTMIGVSLQMATDWQAILVVVLLTAAAQFLRLKVFTSGDLPLAVALLFTAALITGVPGLALASAVIVFISALSETNFDSAQLWARKLDLANDWAIGLLAGLAPALLTPTFDVSLSIGYLPLLVVPFFLMMLAYSYTGISLIAFNVSVATKTSFARVWRDEFQSAPGQYMLMSFIGLCMALMYAMFGLTSFLLCVSTIFVMRLAQEPELVHKMHLEKLAAFLRQPLNSAGIYSNRKSYQHEPVATPVLLEADTARIERYLNFRDQARID